MSINGERGFVLPGIYETGADCSIALGFIEPKEPATDAKTGKKVINLVCVKSP